MSIRLFALAALALSAAPADAQGAKTKVPLFGRTLSFQLPSGMVVANNKRNDTHVLIEYVPKGETLGNWTRLVTVQAYRGLGAAQETTSMSSTSPEMSSLRMLAKERTRSGPRLGAMRLETISKT